jgi:hypothetical protein
MHVILIILLKLVIGDGIVTVTDCRLVRATTIRTS